MINSQNLIFFTEWQEILQKDFNIHSVAQLAEDLKKLTENTLAANGTATLSHKDMPTVRPDLTNWLASLYVMPTHRKKGIATALIKNIIQLAKQKNIKLLHLWTESENLANFYQKLGWVHKETQDYFNKQVYIMQYFI